MLFYFYDKRDTLDNLILSINLVNYYNSYEKQKISYLVTELEDDTKFEHPCLRQITQN